MLLWCFYLPRLSWESCQPEQLCGSRQVGRRQRACESGQRVQRKLGENCFTLIHVQIFLLQVHRGMKGSKYFATLAAVLTYTVVLN